MFSTALIAPDSTNDGVREWGMFTADNGVFFRLKADGKLYAVVRSAGSDTEVDISASTPVGFDVTKGNLYDIRFQWRGVGDYFFYVNQQLVHTVNNLGVVTALTIQNPALPVCYTATRTTQDVSLIIGCADITSEGGVFHNRESYFSTATEKTGFSGTDVPVLSILNPLTVSGDVNTRTATLARITCYASKKSTFKVWTTRDSSLFTGAAFSTVNNGSVVQADTTASAFTVGSANLVTFIPVQAGGTRSVDNPYRDRIEFPVVRGDYLVVTCTISAADVDVVIEWGEQI